MPVLTKKEYIESKSENVVKQRAFEVKTEEAPAEPKEEFLYVLLHPENPVNNFRNFKNEIEIDNKKYKMECVNGTVRTKEEKLANRLLNDGYILIEKLEVKDNAKKTI